MVLMLKSLYCNCFFFISMLFKLCNHLQCSNFYYALKFRLLRFNDEPCNDGSK